MSHEYVISVLLHDRLGIVNEVSSTIFEMGGNILAISQTISKGWFTMIAYAEFSDNISESTVKSAIEGIGDLQVLVAPHETEMEESDKSGDPFIVTVIGDDKAGIIKELSNCFTQKRINIDDIWNEVCDDRIIVIFHIKMPQDIDPGEVRYDLEKIGEEIGVSIMLQHQDIFTATNSLSVYTKH